MKRILQWGLFLGLVVVLYVFYALRWGGESSLISKDLKAKLLNSQVIRTVLSLKRPGDKRFEYLATNTEVVVVELDYAANLPPHPQTENWLQTMMRQTSGKDVEFHQGIETEIPADKALSLTQIVSLAKKTQDPLLAQQPAYLHIIYLAQSADEPSNAGMAISANEIVIYQKVINELSNRDVVKANIERSTLMHEWGHLLGLEHVTTPGCIMDEKVEVYVERKFQGTQIPTSYCDEEDLLLDRLKKEANLEDNP